MRRFNSSAARPGSRSTSMPRATKMSTARGLNASEINTLGILQLHWMGTRASRPPTGRRPAVKLCGFGGLALFLPGPVEPRGQCLDVAGLDGGAGPDPQARRRGDVAGDV